jgi:hypothetical protein
VNFVVNWSLYSHSFLVQIPHSNFFFSPTGSFCTSITQP